MKETKVKNPELIPLFNKLKAVILPYEKYFTVRKDETGYYDLWSEKDLVIAGRKRKEVFFVGLIIQKSYVGFYFMPFYTDTEIEKNTGKDLLKTMKGKSCFHIKSSSSDLLLQIENVLKIGFYLYKDRGWLN